METPEQQHEQAVEVVQNTGTIQGRNGGTLRPWVKGQSGNPVGMKPGTQHFRTILNRFLNESIVVTINDLPFSMTRAEAISFELIRLATSSSDENVRLRAIKELIDRTDGKPTPVLPDTGGGGERPDTVIFYIPNQHSRFKPG